MCIRDSGNTSAPDWSFKPGYLRRIWQPSPKLREVADTPTFAVLDKLKTLAVLDRSLRARIVNSLTQSGFLFMPSQLSLAGPIGAPTGDGQACLLYTSEVMSEMEAIVARAAEFDRTFG